MSVRLKPIPGLIAMAFGTASLALGVAYVTTPHVIEAQAAEAKKEAETPPPPPPPAADLYDVACAVAGEKIKGAFQLGHGVMPEMTGYVTFWINTDGTQTTIDSRNCIISLRPQPKPGVG